MKKTVWLIALVMGMGLVYKLYAGTQYNWGTSTGGSWITPDDTAVKPGSFVVATSSVPPVLTTTGQPWLQSQTIAQINASTAVFTGQIVFCSDCVQSKVCIATGTAGASQWEIVGSSAGAGGSNSLVSCR